MWFLVGTLCSEKCNFLWELSLLDLPRSFIFQEKILDSFNNLLPNVKSYEQDTLNSIILEYILSHNHGLHYAKMKIYFIRNIFEMVINVKITTRVYLFCLVLFSLLFFYFSIVFTKKTYLAVNHESPCLIFQQFYMNEFKKIGNEHNSVVLKWICFKNVNAKSNRKWGYPCSYLKIHISKE